MNRVERPEYGECQFCMNQLARDQCIVRLSRVFGLNSIDCARFSLPGNLSLGLKSLWAVHQDHTQSMRRAPVLCAASLNDGMGLMCEICQFGPRNAGEP
jgi:hypothetical protein